VVFGDLTQRWPAFDKWSSEYLSAVVGDVEVPIYSNDSSINNNHPFEPVLQSRLKFYLDELSSQQNDLRVSSLAMKFVPSLERDFIYPRLGLNFNIDLTTINIGANSAVEPMRQLSRKAQTVYCHFGEPATVLLVAPAMSGLMYRVGRSPFSVRDIDFDQPDFDRFPALRYLTAYKAKLNHGDSLYIPAGFWFTVAYEGEGINLSFQSIEGTSKVSPSLLSKLFRYRLRQPTTYQGEKLMRMEQRAISETNTRLEKYQLT